MSSYYDETADVYSESVRKARKEHGCDACLETIRVGDYYHVIGIVYDGRAHSYKRCERCQRIHLHLRTLPDRMDEVWPNERLDCGEEYTKHWGKEPPPEIAELAFATPEQLQAETAERYAKQATDLKAARAAWRARA